MRWRMAGGLACGLILAGAGLVSAQPGLRGPGGAIGGFNLIGVPAVQRELRLSEAQATQAREVAQRMQARFTQDMSKLKGLNQEERTRRVITLADPHYEEGMKQLRSFLKPEQIERFDQILFQQRGPMGMLEPRVAQTLQVTNEQAKRIAQLVADAQNEQKKVVDADQGKRTRDASVRVEEIAHRANTQAAEVLTPEQRRTWARITGEPFRPDLGGGKPRPGGDAEAPAGASPKTGAPADDPPPRSLSPRP